ncbi:MAG: serine/threonine-protein phosphatase [Synergistaceae bacterium]|nr:protein phosphatase 2C domain-containing protein [Synergistota bacterium]NLM70663.1 serine/threonine-protein phosphatase [Synergistaceae bacterium]
MKIMPGNHQHIGARSEQQDAFAFSDLSNASFLAHGGALAVLADGMGGHADGGEAAKIAVAEFIESYSRKGLDETIEEALKRAILDANEAVYSFSTEIGHIGDCGATLVAAVIHEGGVYWVYAGDSRLYMTDGQSLTPLTEDHTCGNDLDRAARRGRIDWEKALSYPRREALISYVGNIEIPRIGRGSLLSSGEGLPPNGFTLLLCSDGLYKTLDEEAILALYSRDPQEWSSALVERVLEEKRPFQDNVTVLCLALVSEG